MTSAALLNDDQISKIATRLSKDETLRLPGQQTRGDEPSTTGMRSKYLHALLSHDPGVFLERHGDQLIDDELQYFEALRSTNYEVNFYLNLIEDSRKTQAGAKKSQLGSVAKNRRLAQLERLEQRGYFSEEAMRSREPYLHHLYIGQYAGERPPEAETPAEGAAASSAEAMPSTKVLPNDTTEGSAGPVPRASASLASSIMNRQDELQLLLRREAEREAYAMQEAEEESESEDEDLDENLDNGADRKKEHADNAAKGTTGDRGQLGGWRAPEAITSEERIEYQDAFLDAMKQKFLSGQDAGIDYMTIDRDASLDQHFAKEVERDAEDAYFDAD